MIRSQSTSAVLALALLCLPLPAFADWQAGVDAFKAGDHGTAAAEFAAEVERRPDWHGAHLMLGRALLGQKRSEQALASFQAAARLAPEDPGVAILTAHTAAKLGKWTLATQALEPVDASQLPAKERVSYHQLTGQAALERGDRAAARVSFGRAAALAPSSHKLQYMLGYLADKDRDLAAAETHLTAAAKLAPKDVKAASLLTQVLLARAVGADGDAVKKACSKGVPQGRRLAKLDGSPDHLVLAGRLELCAGNLEEAGDFLDRAVDARGDDWSSRYYLGRARALQGSWLEAESALAPALGLNLDAAGLRKVHGLLGFVNEGRQSFEAAIEHYGKAGDTERVAKAREALEIQEHNEEVARLEAEAADLAKQLQDLEKEGQSAGQSLPLSREPS